jgi:shikimate dehydrogenase
MSAIFTLGIDYVYMSFDILPQNVAHAVVQFKKEHIKGFNVTIPYKEIIMPYLDGVDEYASRIGAVNTVNNENGRLKGYNTDGVGYVKSLREQTGFDPRGMKVLMIGAGGAAKAVAFSLLEAGVHTIIIANRTLERADALCRHLHIYFSGASAQCIGMPDINTIDHKTINLVINTTSLGMKGAGDIDIDLTDFKNDTVVSDIVYNPLETPLLKRAGQAGLKTHDGAGMLVYQGAESFKIWTGVQPPVDVMRQAVLRALQERH